MSSTTDKQLGMNRDITRRDFIDGSLKFAAGMMAAPYATAANGSSANPANYYPPNLTGLRGSHDGSFETAHQLAWQGRKNWGPIQEPDPGEYDLAVVGAGFSGLAAAIFYQQKHPGARILILDNHDDFGGHAKRNEFSINGQTVIGYGGSQSFEAPSQYSKVAKQLLKDLGISTSKLSDAYDTKFYERHGLGAAVYFDKANFGHSKLLHTALWDPSGFLPLADKATPAFESVDQMPLSDEGKNQLKRLITNKEDVLPDHSVFSEPDFLWTISYGQFIREFHGISDPGVLLLLNAVLDSYMGYNINAIPAFEALTLGLPGLQSTSLGKFAGLAETAADLLVEPYTYHFPDGNASVARMMVRQLIPASAPGNTMFDIVKAAFDYSQLDRKANDVRLRLNSMVVNVEHNGDAANAKNVVVNYVRDGQAESITAKQVVLACYNMAIPHLCPELPQQQKDALSKLVKIPLVYSNVLLSNWRSFKEAEIGAVYSPGRWHKSALIDFPVSMADYQFSKSPDDPIVVHLTAAASDHVGSPDDQSRACRYEMLGRSFDDYERELRSHFAEMLADTNFDPARDIAGITVNRWPHGYAWDNNGLFHDYEEGKEPHILGKKPFGRIAIANSDASARAYMDAAFDEAYRAVEELSGST